jgi:hypothetical protein
VKASGLGFESLAKKEIYCFARGTNDDQTSDRTLLDDTVFTAF